MTVCIVALCENGKQAVVAADMMTSMGVGALEVLRDNAAIKIKPWQKNIAIVHSGTVLESEYVFKEMDAESGDVPEDMGGIAKFISKKSTEWVKETRDAKVKNILGENVCFNTLVEKIGSMVSGPLFEVWQSIKEVKCGVFLIVGYDSDLDTCVIYQVHGESVTDLRSHEHCAIGSGNVYASAVLDSIGYTRELSLSEAIFHVYCAKRSSEITYGVGKNTMMALLSHDKEVLWIKDAEAFEFLNKLRQRKIKLNLEEQNELSQNLSL